jgi:curved DNA-binding protein CbpA
MMPDERDAYLVLQVVPQAEDDVIRAAYRALARRYHPDGVSPNPVRMAEINRAYERIGRPERRRRYDSERRPPVAVGPGTSPSQPYDPWAARSGASAPRVGSEAATVIDFGRYAGWRITDVARQDPDYLRWLSRHSTGVRFREAIARSLPGDPELGRRASALGQGWG